MSAIFNISTHLRIVGLLLLLLAAGHLDFPRRFRWPSDLAKITPVNRATFISHTLFLVLFLALIGVMSLFVPSLLLEPTPLGTVILAGLATFFIAKTLAHFLLFRPSHWPVSSARLPIHLLLSTPWIYFAATYAAAFFHTLR